MNIKWTNLQTSFVKDNASDMTDKVLTEKLNNVFGTTFTFAAVRRKRQLMGIKKAKGRGVCEVL